jgi:alkylated DNA nucleotide flippase Atl1
MTGFAVMAILCAMSYEGVKMAGHKRTWHDKLYGNRSLPKIEPISDRMSKKWGRGTMVTPAPAEVDEIMWMVPQGKLITIGRIQEMIARKHEADVTCPVMTGMSAWIAAQAAADDEAEGRNKVTPYWRTLKTDGELNPKYPGGIEGQKARLEAEGHRVVRKGSKHIVQNYEGALVVW